MVLMVFLVSFILAVVCDHTACQPAACIAFWHIFMSLVPRVYSQYPSLSSCAALNMRYLYYFCSLILAFLNYVGTMAGGREGREAPLCRKAPVAATHSLEHGIPCIPGCPF